MKMRKIQLIIVLMSTACAVMAQSSTPVAKTSVVQNEKVVESAQFSLSKNPAFLFDDGGNLIMKLGSDDTPAAKLPLKENSYMEVVFSTLDESTNKRDVAISSAGYGTFFSAFQTIVPDGDIEVYAPTYSSGRLQLDQTTRLLPGTVLPAETGVLVKNEGDYSFAYSEEPADEVLSALSGSAIELPVTDFEGTIYSLAKKNGTVAFYRYSAQMTKAGKAFLVLDGDNSSKEIMFDILPGATAVDSPSSHSENPTDMFNTAGQKVDRKYKGVVISGGKKYLNK